MIVWTFLDFTELNGRNRIRDWLAGLKPVVAKEVAATLRVKLEFARAQPLLRPPLFEPLTGYPGILEIKFKARKVQWRPLGFYGPEQLEFTLLVGAKEMNNRFVPASAPETAKGRRALVLADRRYVTSQCLL